MRRRFDRKQRQLCSQVEHAIDLALGMSSDPLLQGCWVVDVRPAGGPQLTVRIQTDDPVDIDALEQHLERATPWLRSEVAGFVNRKRVPQLRVVWAGPDA